MRARVQRADADADGAEQARNKFGTVSHVIGFVSFIVYRFNCLHGDPLSSLQRPPAFGCGLFGFRFYFVFAPFFSVKFGFWFSSFLCRTPSKKGIKGGLSESLEEKPH